MSPFQIAVFAIAIVIIVGSVIVFSMQRGSASQSKIPIDVWGTISADVFNEFQKRINELERDSLFVNYREISPDQFEAVLVEALASGSGPDAVIMSDDLLIKHENKLFLIDYKFYTQKTFKDNFIESGEILLRENGILGFPLTIDPLVFYWNRTILNNEGISSPPQFWDDLLGLIPRLVKRDSASNISRAVIALGEYQNINNAKDILISMIQQSGNNIISRNPQTGKFEAVIEQNPGFTVRPAESALNYFVQFSNPTRDVYTWNKSMPNSQQMFTTGDLVFYIGYASERNFLIQKNPNLNFDVSVLPQSKSIPGQNIKRTVGQVHFISILNRSPKISAAFGALNTITKPENMRILAELTELPSVRRDVSISTAQSSYMDSFASSALFSVPFIDPNVTETNKIFRDMIESVVIGNQNANRAVQRASDELKSVIR